MVKMCPFGGVCDHEEETKEYGSVESTSSGDDGITETVKLAICRAINCQRLGENNDSEEKPINTDSKEKEYSSLKLNDSFSF